MRVDNGNALDLSGAQGEEITVTVKETTGKPLLVSYTLNGRNASLSPDRSNDRFSFRLDKNDRDPTLATMLFTFTGTDDHYDIVFQGDSGGQISRHEVIQEFDVPGDSITYTIDII